MHTDITYSNLNIEEINDASAVLALCWKAAYKGLVNDEYLSSLESTHWVEFLEKSINDNTATCIVAKKDNKIVGITVFGKSITEKYPNDGEIISLYVTPESIGQGIGHVLFEKAEHFITKQGYNNCITCTFVENSKAIRFYKSHGYEIVSESEIVTMGKQDLPYVIMRKAL